MSINLKNKIVFITGASAGIGYACAEGFAEQGANLIITARRLDRLEALAAKLQQQYKINVLPLQLDVSDKVAVKTLVTGLDEKWQAIDVLINNAGVSLSTESFKDVAIEKFDQMIDVNVKGLLYVTKAILPLMLERNNGHIINIGSVASHYIYPGGNVYPATKHALKAISQILRIDLLGTAIRVTQVDPGATETELAEMRWDKERVKKYYEKMIPLQSVDIAESVIFCSTRDYHINIDNIIVNNIDMAGCYNAHKGSGNNSLFD